ncbi:MAG TPA: class I SAM-dependent methyltransferase [Vicinamibacteria bacterium]|nr:class I SAM-dependent methyltransferase [Vicinamibacteria bacterium]
MQAAATLELLWPFAGARVLDVGGGHGQTTGALVAAGFEVTVLGSDSACEARVRAWTASSRARFLRADLLAPGLPDRSFDVVLCYRLLPHVRRWPALVATLCRLARAAVIVDYPSRRSVNAAADLLFGFKRRVEKDTRPFTVFSDDELEAAFAGHGFRTTGRRPQFFFPMALHRATRAAPLARLLEGGAKAAGLTRRFGSPVILRLERRG